MNQGNDTARHLLMGLLALQTGLIDQAALVAAFHAWSQDKARSLADHLVALGHLDAAHRPLLDGLAAAHLARHGGDAEKSLAAIPAGPSTRESLGRIGDPDIEGTLAVVGSGPTRQDGVGDSDRTGTYSVGSATSDGQRFRVLRPHARGGLGAVFVAVDNELHREVALKQILDTHADDPTSRQRFLLEAEVTGGLEHPGIVPVYGLGTYGDGRPYYAMRFIRGDSLKEAIERFHSDAALKNNPGLRSLELHKLLRRFLDVCNAIEYAHSRGVLHRDIKPGNIIVGRHGETLVVDWGLAKTTGQSDPGSVERTLSPSSASGTAETLPGSAMGTPAYMSPEQAEGQLDCLGPHSDVYSLGATLYCLLAGEPPFAGNALDVIPRVQRGDFRPLRAIDPAIDPALEAVCLKAMALKPGDRHATPKALADDIERWMADEPVSAWREPLQRRARRWAQRNRSLVTGAAAAMLAGVVGLAAVLAVQTRAKADLARSLANETKANQNLAAANAELSRSRAAVQARFELAVDAIKTFHTGVSGDFLLKQDQFKELRDRLLKSASDFYGRLGALLGKETDVGSRRALARANFEVADLTEKVGRKEDALMAHRTVLARREVLANDPAADPEAKADVGRSLTEIASLLESTGKLGEAEPTYRRAESLLAGLLRSSPPAPAVRAALAACRTRLGRLLSATGRHADALAAYRLAQADQETLAKATGASDEARRDLAETTHRIGAVLSDLGKPSDADAQYRAALAILQKLVDANPAVTTYPSDLARCHTNLGYLLMSTGQYARSEAELRAALGILQKLVGENPAVTQFRSDLARSHSHLGWLMRIGGRLPEMRVEYRAALAIRQKLADDNPSVTEYQRALATSYTALADGLADTDDQSGAEAQYRAALAILQKLVDENSAVTGFRSDLAILHERIATVRMLMGKPSDSEAHYRTALAILQRLVDDNPSAPEFRVLLMTMHRNFGLDLIRIGRPLDAEAKHRAALAIEQKLADNDFAGVGYRASLAWTRNCLGDALAQTSRLSDAEAEYRAALAIQQKLADDNPKNIDYQCAPASTFTRIGKLRQREGRTAEARDLYRRAVALLERFPIRSAGDLYDLACSKALLAGVAAESASGLSAAEGRAEADRAMDTLRRAVAMGHRGFWSMQTDTDLDPLRHRDDFRLLMLDLAMPANPFAR